MKKLVLIITVAFALFLTSCDLVDKVPSDVLSTILEETTTTGDETTTTTEEQQTTSTEDNLINDTIALKLQSLIDAKSYKMNYHARLKTDELELTFNPLYTVQKYTNEQDKLVYQVSYYNDIMQAFGLQAFDFILDQRTETVYINNTLAWYKGSFEEINTLAGQPIFDYIFAEDTTTDDEMALEIEYVQNLILDAIINFNSATYIESIDDNGRTLQHFELEYNVYNVLSELFDHYNEQQTETDVDNLEELLESINMNDIFDLFKTFTIDIYFEEDSFDIGRIEFDVMNILDNDIFLNFIQSAMPSDEVNIKKFIGYVQDLELSVSLFDINTLPEITIPQNAIDGLPIEQITIPVEPSIPTDTTNETDESDADVPSEDPSPLTESEIDQAIDSLLNADSYETGVQFKLATDEMGLVVNPLFKFQKYTEENNEVYNIYYYNQLMEGAGLLPLQFIVDQRTETVYMSDAYRWYKGTFEEFETVTGDPVFDYLFDFENQLTADEYDEYMIIQNTIINGIVNYNEAVYMGTVEDDGRTLYQYEIDLDIYTIVKNLFDYYNEQEIEPLYPNFDEYLAQFAPEEITDLFRSFTFDIYIEESSKNIGRIEIDIVKLLNNDTIFNQIETYLFETEGITIDVEALLNYFNDFELSINIHDLNQLPEITIPDDALNGLSLELMNAPDDFDPSKVTDVQLGDSIDVDLTEFDFIDNIYYSFTLTEEQNIRLSTICDYDTDFMKYYLYHQDFDRIYVDEYNSDDHAIYYNLPAGTYYIGISGSGLGGGTLTLDTYEINEVPVEIGEEFAVDTETLEPTYYSFTLDEMESITISPFYDYAEGYLIIYLKDADQKNLFPDLYIGGTEVYYDLPAGTYYVEFIGEGSGTATIDLFDNFATPFNVGEPIEIDLSTLDPSVGPIYYTFTIDTPQDIALSSNINFENWIDYSIQTDLFDYIDPSIVMDGKTIYKDLPVGTYYIEVYGEGNSIVTLHVHDFSLDGNLIIVGDTTTVNIDTLSEETPIYYSFTLTQEESLLIGMSKDLTNFTGQFDYEILDSNYNTINPQSDIYTLEKDIYYQLAAGTYYIRVTGEGTGLGYISLETYDFAITPTALDSTIQINLEDFDLTSYPVYYSFSLDALQELAVTLTSNGDIPYFYLYDSNFNRFMIDDSLDNTYYFNTLTPGTYYLEIFGLGTGTTLITFESNPIEFTNINIGDALSFDSTNFVDSYSPIYYTFTLDEVKDLAIGLDFGVNGEGFYNLYYNNLNDLIESDTYDTGFDLYYDLPAGTYFVEIFGFEDVSGSLIVISNEINAEEIIFDTPIDIELSSFETLDDTLYYTFTIEEEHDITVSLEYDFYKGWAYHSLYNSNLEYIDASEVDADSYIGLQPDTYYLEIVGGGEGILTFLVQ